MGIFIFSPADIMEHRCLLRFQKLKCSVSFFQVLEDFRNYVHPLGRNLLFVENWGVQAFIGHNFFAQHKEPKMKSDHDVLQIQVKISFPGPLELAHIKSLYVNAPTNLTLTDNKQIP